MQGLLNLINGIGAVGLMALGFACYFAGASCILGGAWLLYAASRRNAQVSHITGWLVMACGFVFLGFPEFVNLSTASLGGTRRIAAAALTAYSRPPAAANAWLGLSPQETLLAVIRSFLLFFVFLGLTFVFRAVVRMKAFFRKEERRWFPALMNALAGVAVLNIDLLVTLLIAQYNAGP